MPEHTPEPKKTAKQNYMELLGNRMDIESPPGTKVRFDKPTAGYRFDQETAAKAGLVKDQVYTVKETIAYSFSSTVELEEYPGTKFNTVMFCKVS